MSSWEPFSKNNIRDPYSMYRRIRDKESIITTSTGELVFTSYEDVKNLLQNNTLYSGIRLDWLKENREMFEKRGLDISGIETALLAFMPFLNPPEHTTVRGFFSRVWKEWDVEKSIRETAERLLADKAEGFDFVHEYSSRLPFLIISNILGPELTENPDLRKRTNSFFRILDIYLSIKDLAEINDSCNYLISYFRSMIRKRRIRTDANDSLISKLIAENSTLRILNEDQLISICMGILLAGTETTSSFLGNALLTLLQRPGSLEQLRENKSLINPGIEELLRYDPPAQLSVRKSAEDFTYKGLHVEKGQTMILCIGSANRDPLKFEDPDELILDRSPNPHLSFGAGRHRCLGDWLGRMETKISLETLLDKFDHLNLMKEPEWHNSTTIRSLKSLIVQAH